FVSTKDIPPEGANADELCKWLGEQISEIIRFYNFEVADSSDKWEITVVADCVQSPGETEQSLRTEIAGASIQVKAVEDAFEETPFGESAGSSRPSPVAIGLAMKLLGEDDVGLAINVVPPESAQIRSAKKQVLIAANFIAALVLVMILTAGGFGLMTNSVEQRINQSKQDGGTQSIHKLLREKEALDRRIKQLSERPELLKNIFASHPAVDWPGLLEDIRSRTPETLRITRLHSNKKDSGVYLELLNKSNHIESASLAHTKKDYEAGDLIRYAINCSLASEEKGS
ncbi:MAG: PilN domain-containing protein, partial [Planctomycetota bacterium]